MSQVILPKPDADPQSPSPPAAPPSMPSSPASGFSGEIWTGVPEHARSVASPARAGRQPRLNPPVPLTAQPPAITDGSVHRQPDNLCSRRKQIVGDLGRRRAQAAGLSETAGSPQAPGPGREQHTLQVLIRRRREVTRRHILLFFHSSPVPSSARRRHSSRSELSRTDPPTRPGSTPGWITLEPAPSGEDACGGTTYVPVMRTINAGSSMPYGLHQSLAVEGFRDIHGMISGSRCARTKNHADRRDDCPESLAILKLAESAWSAVP